MSGTVPPTGHVTGTWYALEVCFWLVAGIVGSLTFWLVQILAGSGTITAFMGEQIVAAAGYPARLAPVIGWLVHVGVSLSYALLAGIAVLLARRAPVWIATGIALVAALVLGWVTAVIAPPAISVTVGLLSLRGWPTELYPLNTEIGLPFWNHILFFLVTSVIQMLGPTVTRRTQTRGNMKRTLRV